MGKEGASVFLIDRSGKTVTLVAAIGLNQESIGKLSFPLGMGIAGWVAEQKVPLALEDPYSDPRFAYVPESGIEKFKSLVAAPIMDDDRCLGVIFVLSSAVWQATSSDLTLLTTTANQLSGVIKSARLFQNIQDRLAELATIYEIGLALTSTLDLEQLLSLIAKNSAQSLRAQGCTIRLMNLPETFPHDVRLNRRGNHLTSTRGRAMTDRPPGKSPLYQTCRDARRCP
jgi:signal transduction protein with GAF and PtsI domain